MRKTAIYRDDLFLDHNPGPSHPESPQRLQVIYNELDKESIGGRFIYPRFDPASTQIIELNHSPQLVKRVAATAGKSSGFLDADTQTSANSYSAACLAVGAPAIMPKTIIPWGFACLTMWLLPHGGHNETWV